MILAPFFEVSVGPALCRHQFFEPLRQKKMHFGLASPTLCPQLSDGQLCLLNNARGAKARTQCASLLHLPNGNKVRGHSRPQRFVENSKEEELGGSKKTFSARKQEAGKKWRVKCWEKNDCTPARVYWHHWIAKKKVLQVKLWPCPIY